MACEAPSKSNAKPAASTGPRHFIATTGGDSVAAPEFLARPNVPDGQGRRPTSLRVEAYGSMRSPTSFGYTEEPGEGMFDGGTTAGGMVLLPPETDMYEIGYDFAMPGKTLSTCYFVAGPNVSFAAGLPYTNSGSVASGYSWGVTSSELIFSTHGTTGTKSNAFKLTSTQNIAFRSNTNFWGTFDHAITAARTWTFPDATGTVALTSDLFTGGPFTAGSVIFSAGTLALAEDNANFFWNDSLNRLGIGTSSPSFPLHVLSTGSAVRIETSSTGGAPQLLYLYNNSTGGAEIKIETAGTANDPYIAFYPNGANTWQLGCDNSVAGDPFVLSTGGFLGLSNVLSVTTAAAFTFGVASTTTATLSLAHASSALLTSFTAGNASAAVTYTLPTAGPAANGYALTSTTAGVMSWTALTTGTVTGTGTSGYVAFWDAASNITGEANLFWDAAANRLGIGTAAPGSILEITSSAAINAKAITTGSGNVSAQWTASSTSDLSSHALVQYDAGATGTSFGLARAHLALLLGFGASLSGMAIGTSTADFLVFGTNDAERMRILSGGNIGIGNTNPSTILEITAAANVNVKADTTGSGNVAAQFTASNTSDLGSVAMGQYDAGATGTTFGISRPHLAFLLSFGASSVGLAVGTLTSDPIYFGINNAEVARIDTSGNLGIGTTGPDAKLDVLSTTEQVRFTYTDGSVYASNTVNSSGQLLVTSTGNAFSYTGAFTTGSGASINANRGLQVIHSAGPSAATGAYGIRSAITRTSAGNDTNTAALYLAGTISGAVTAVSYDGLYVENPTLAGGGAITTAYGVRVANITSGSTNYSFYGGTAQSYFGGRVGVNVTAPAAMIDADQSSTTAAIPVLKLDQADVSEEFIRFIGTSANGVLTQSIVEAADVATATIAGYLKVFVQDDGNQLTDQAYYLPIYTLA